MTPEANPTYVQTIDTENRRQFLLRTIFSVRFFSRGYTDGRCAAIRMLCEMFLKLGESPQRISLGLLECVYPAFPDHSRIK